MDLDGVWQRHMVWNLWFQAVLLQRQHGARTLEPQAGTKGGLLVSSHPQHSFLFSPNWTAFTINSRWTLTSPAKPSLHSAYILEREFTILKSMNKLYLYCFWKWLLFPHLKQREPQGCWQNLSLQLLCANALVGLY